MPFCNEMDKHCDVFLHQHYAKRKLCPLLVGVLLRERDSNCLNGESKGCVRKGQRFLFGSAMHSKQAQIGESNSAENFILILVAVLVLSVVKSNSNKAICCVWCGDKAVMNA